MICPDDQPLTEGQMRSKIKDILQTKTQAELARELNISRAYMSEIVRGSRGISAKVAKKLGYKANVRYVRIAQYKKEK